MNNGLPKLPLYRHIIVKGAFSFSAPVQEQSSFVELHERHCTIFSLKLFSQEATVQRVWNPLASRSAYANLEVRRKQI